MIKMNLFYVFLLYLEEKEELNYLVCKLINSNSLVNNL